MRLHSNILSRQEVGARGETLQEDRGGVFDACGTDNGEGRVSLNIESHQLSFQRLCLK